LVCRLAVEAGFAGLREVGLSSMDGGDGRRYGGVI